MSTTLLSTAFEGNFTHRLTFYSTLSNQTEFKEFGGGGLWLTALKKKITIIIVSLK